MTLLPFRRRVPPFLIWMPQEATTMKTTITTDRWAYASKSREKKGKGYQCKFIRRQRVTMHQFRYGSHCSCECVVYGRLPHRQGNTPIARNMHWEHHRGYMCLKSSRQHSLMLPPECQLHLKLFVYCLRLCYLSPPNSENNHTMLLSSCSPMVWINLIMDSSKRLRW